MKPNVRRQGGFSIIELMIAVALGLVILAALTTFFVKTSANRHEMERNTRQIENGRYAIDTLRDDIVLAGFYADMQPLATPAWSTLPICPSNAGNPADLGFAASPAYTAPYPLVGFQDGAGVPAGCTPDYLPNTDVLVVHRFNTESVTVAQAGAGTPSDHPASSQWYVQVSQCPDDDPAMPFKVGVGSAGSGTFNLRRFDCATAAVLWRLHQAVYYVRDYSVNAGDGLPTLVRKSINITGGGVVMQEDALVEGIQAMRVDYGIDSDGNGSADLWKRCDAASPCAAGDWGNVTAAKIYVLSRNLEASPQYVDTKTYAMGLSGTLGPFNDGFKRHVYSAQVNLPNRTGPREPQFKVAP